MTAAHEADVAIVGLGPVGALAAHLCALHGLSAVGFEREPDVHALPRAVVVDDEVQRILQGAGLLEAVLPYAEATRGAEFVDAAGARIMGVEIPAGLRTANGHPPLLGVHQPDLERALRARLAARPAVAMRLAHEVERVTQDGDGVRLAVRDLGRNETRHWRTRWLLGCDGARSGVRRACGIGWHSLGYDHLWLVVDVLLEREVALPPFVQQICDPDRPTTVVPLPGRRRRWEFQLRAGETAASMEQPDRVWALLAPWLRPGDAAIERAVVYRFHATIAERFRSGAAFVAGDAAHQTPPFLGQGMCTGMKDVANLVWKIAAVHHDRAADRLLDTYDEERRPLAVAMVDHSVSIGRLIDAYAAMARGGPVPPAALREYGYGGSAALPHLRAGLLARDDDPLRGRPVPQVPIAVRGGTRPLDDVVGPRWAVLGAKDPAACMHADARRFWSDLGAAVLALAEPSAARLGGADAVVVRPDRLVYGAATPDRDLDMLTGELRRALGR